MAVTVLCVCTYNRTRSVMMEALLQQHLAAVDVDARVASAGTQADGQPPTRETVRLLVARGVDVSTRRSRPLDEDTVSAADLIVTAERDHVVAVASAWPAAFEKTFTLPELVGRMDPIGGRLGGPMEEWLVLLNAGRLAGIRYLDDRSVGEVADPTGGSKQRWATAFEQIDELTHRLARGLS